MIDPEWIEVVLPTRPAPEDLASLLLLASRLMDGSEEHKAWLAAFCAGSKDELVKIAAAVGLIQVGPDRMPEDVIPYLVEQLA